MSRELNCFLEKRTFFFKKKIFNSNRTFQKNVIWFIILIKGSRIGIGECNPILDQYALNNLKKFEVELKNVSKKILFLKKMEIRYYYKYISYSSIFFGLEQVFLSFKNEFPVLYYSEFFCGKKGISISYLIWLNSFIKRKNAIKKIEDKINGGFSFIKMKISPKLFNNQFFVLKKIKRKYPFIKIRLDANGCFSNIKDTLYFLKKFYDLNIIDSVEQPILSGNWKDMSIICKKSKLPIALDEELKNISVLEEKKKLLDIIQPKYIVLKPSINGGFYGSEEWIVEASKRGIKWYISSSLESNIGINAIAQWTFIMGKKYNNNQKYNNVHGLSTGALYINNWISSLKIEKGFIWNNPRVKWDIKVLLNK
ncbi:enolase C-terminal domain-like protein [Blattabacterium cuenoti]|uniref:enolase C-terminal domain-like protein n=1 Tax=Blattabacterium cuenoti TaxID=1653831 RepID=UPI00163CB1C0|nr:enolase C-terminal domain-like protein [Blattabacterium cuenoti]